MIDANDLFRKIKNDEVLNNSLTYAGPEIKSLVLTDITHEVNIAHNPDTNAVESVLVTLRFNKSHSATFTVSLNALRVIIDAIMFTTKDISCISSEGTYFSYNPHIDRKLTIITQCDQGGIGEIYSIMCDNDTGINDEFAFTTKDLEHVLFDILTAAYIEYLYEVNNTIIIPPKEPVPPVSIQKLREEYK